VSDGDDPENAGCATDAINLDSQQLAFPPGTIVGNLELRYSVRCAASWGRFTPAAAMDGMGPAIVTVQAIRPDDRVTTPWSGPYTGGLVYGNLLHAGPGCVLAHILITLGTSQVMEVATTCRHGT
jgi:hypothetical protein